MPATVNITVDGYLFQEHSPDHISRLTMMITKPSQLRKWKYPENVTDQLTFSDDIPVGLLIRANFTKALEPTEILQSTNGGPYAFKTRLGRCVAGPVNRIKGNKVSCN